MANQQWLMGGLLTAALALLAGAPPGFGSPLPGFDISSSAPTPSHPQSTPKKHFLVAYDAVGGAADIGVHMGARVGPDDGAPPSPEGDEFPRPVTSQHAMESPGAGDTEQPQVERPESSGAGGEDITPAPRPDIQQPEIQRPEIEAPSVQTPDIQRPEIARPDD